MKLFVESSCMVNQLRADIFTSIILLSYVLGASAQSIDAIFNVQSNCNGNAADGTPFTTKLAQYYAECVTLVNYGLATTNAYGSDELSRIHLATFFGIRPAVGDATEVNPTDEANANTVSRSYGAVYKFLATGVIAGYTGKPDLYCNSDWLEQKSGSDLALDSQGVAGTQTIQEKYPNDFVTVENGVTVQNVPYWAAKYKDYIFDIVYPGGSYCASGQYMANTITAQLTTRVLTLCPASFAVRRSLGGTVSLGSKAPTPGTILQLVSPQSINLFHELFHLVLGNGATPDTGRTSIEVIDMINRGQGNAAVVNPESYAQMANAFWYSQQWWGTKKNIRYGFWSGQCVQIQTTA